MSLTEIFWILLMTRYTKSKSSHQSCTTKKSSTSSQTPVMSCHAKISQTHRYLFMVFTKLQQNIYHVRSTYQPTSPKTIIQRLIQRLPNYLPWSRHLTRSEDNHHAENGSHSDYASYDNSHSNEIRLDNPRVTTFAQMTNPTMTTTPAVKATAATTIDQWQYHRWCSHRNHHPKVDRNEFL